MPSHPAEGKAPGGTEALYRRFVGPLLTRDDGADAERLSRLTLTTLAQVALRRNWPNAWPGGDMA